jgi:small subunit ribosomal protein S4
MTKIISSKMKYCRTTSSNIFGSKKFKNPTPPGQHGKRKRKPTEYCKQIREAKKLRLFYGNLKLAYLKTLYEKVKTFKGNKIDKLIEFLERRLSTVVFRGKFASTISGAKQLISHGFIQVNGQKVDISSYLVKEGDIVTLSQKMKENHLILTAISSESRAIPPFLDGSKKFEIKFLNRTGFDNSLYPCQMQLQKIIEFLSR